MKDALAIQDDTDQTVAAEVDPDADDPEASTLLDSIVQGNQAETEADSEDTAPEKPARSASSPFRELRRSSRLRAAVSSVADSSSARAAVPPSMA